MTDVIIRRPDPSEAPLLAEVSERLFRDAFGAANDPAQIDAHCAASYGQPQQHRELTDPARVVLFAEAGGRIVAYAILHARTKPPGLLADALQTAEVERFYVDPSQHGTGLAQTLMSGCFDVARSWGADTIWLGVWQANPRAIAFYSKCGFRIIGVQTFMLGTEAQDDYVMARGVADE